MRRVLSFQVRGAFGLLMAVSVGSCGRSTPSAQDSTSARAARASAKSGTFTLGGLPQLAQPLDTLLANAAAFDAFVASAEANTPVQNPDTRKIKTDKSCSGPAHVDITTQALATSGVYSYTDLASGTNGNAYGYMIGTIQNGGACAPAGIGIPARTTGNPGTAIIFVALKPNGSTATATDFQVRIVDSTTRQDVPGSPLPIVPCDSTKHSWLGDHQTAKRWKDRCDHMLARTSLGHPAADDIDDAWTLWISCAANCCYADTGGMVDFGADSTRRDSTHRRGAAPAAPALKKS